MRLRVSSTGGTDKNGSWFRKLHGVTITRDVTLTVEQAKAAALDQLRVMSVPIDERKLLAWLGQLSLDTISRETSPDVEKVRMRSYADRLRCYPADAVKAALFPNPLWKFWPSWSEVDEKLKAAMLLREMIMVEIENGAFEETPDEVPRPSFKKDREMSRAERDGDFHARMRAIGDGYLVPKKKEIAERMKALRKALGLYSPRQLNREGVRSLWRDRLENAESLRNLEEHNGGIGKQVHLHILRGALKTVPELSTPSRQADLEALEAWEKEQMGVV